MTTLNFKPEVRKTLDYFFLNWHIEYKSVETYAVLKQNKKKQTNLSFAIVLEDYEVIKVMYPRMRFPVTKGATKAVTAGVCLQGFILALLLTNACGWEIKTEWGDMKMINTVSTRVITVSSVLR